MGKIKIKTNTLVGLKKDFRILMNCIYILKRKKIIKRYLSKYNVRKLHLGSNKTMLAGWLCSDIVPQNKHSIYFDVTKRFPFKDNTFDYVYAEHLIEHLYFYQEKYMLNECFRVLKKNGRIRLATPDLAVILRLYTDRKKSFGNQYIKWSVDNFSAIPVLYNPVIVINNLFHNWEHKFLYDFDFLKETLIKCGFSKIERYAYSKSNDVYLQNIERHHENVDNLEMVEFETLIVEAVKP